jgi:hypothetical protein
MGFYPFEVTAPHLVYTLLGGYVSCHLMHDVLDASVLKFELNIQVHRHIWHV